MDKNEITFGVVSDIHAEWWAQEDLDRIGDKIRSNLEDSDVILFAGDISDGVRAIRVAEYLFPEKLVLLVAGNHEFYGGTRDRICHAMKEAAILTRGVKFLNRSSSEIECEGFQVRILGVTLWTDFDLFGTQPISMSLADRKSVWNDEAKKFIQPYPDLYNIYRDKPNYVTSHDLLQYHIEDRDWLLQELDKPFDGRTVVLTHHAPFSFSVKPQHVDSIISPCFASRMENLLIDRNVDLVVSGHTHHSVDRTLGNTRFISNQVGYLGSMVGRSTYTETGNFGTTVILTKAGN